MSLSTVSCQTVTGPAPWISIWDLMEREDSGLKPKEQLYRKFKIMEQTCIVLVCLYHILKQNGYTRHCILNCCTDSYQVLELWGPLQYVEITHVSSEVSAWVMETLIILRRYEQGSNRITYIDVKNAMVVQIALNIFNWS